LQGKLQGKTLVSRNGRNFSAFLGVPYAQARRFQPPELAVNWEGTLQATEYRPQCAQSMWLSHENIGEENCLHLQVLSPDLTANLPVMVYFHGGGFTIGSSNVYGPEYFMDEDIVLVLVNYRLGPFGFLSMQDEILPGNNGLRDQNMALRCVQSNIAQFGGNPGSVTIFGNSAGGASVNFHILSPQSAGLFHGAILQSGSSLNPWAMSRNPKEMARRFGKSLGCPTKTSNHLLKCLLTKKTDEILDAMEPLVQWGYDPFTPFGAVVEPALPGAFLAEEPELLMETGRFYKVPIIAGVTENEGLLMHSSYVFQNPELLQDINENWRKVLPITLEYDEFYTNFTRHHKLEVSMKIRKFYFQERPINEETRQQLTNVYSDRFFNHGVRKGALLMAKHTPVYMYMFAHNRGDYSILKFYGIEEVQGVSHAEELSFQFANTFGLAPEFIKGSAAEEVSKNFIKLWASFAKEKKPNALWGTQQIWPSVANDEIIGKSPLQYYRIDSDTQLINEPFTDRVKFWEETLEAAQKGGHYRDEL
jgi:carboxylesterase type B